MVNIGVGEDMSIAEFADIVADIVDYHGTLPSIRRSQTVLHADSSTSHGSHRLGGPQKYRFGTNSEHTQLFWKVDAGALSAARLRVREAAATAPTSTFPGDLRMPIDMRSAPPPSSAVSTITTLRRRTSARHGQAAAIALGPRARIGTLAIETIGKPGALFRGSRMRRGQRRADKREVDFRRRPMDAGRMMSLAVRFAGRIRAAARAR